MPVLTRSRGALRQPLPRPWSSSIYSPRALPSRLIHQPANAGEETFDYTTDVLIVGSGGGALTAALRSRDLSMRTLVVEKSSLVGGTTAYSGGSAWVPCSHLQTREGIRDSLEDAMTYIQAVVKEGGPASSHERRTAYLENGPKMAKFLEDRGFKWRLDNPYPDYHALEPGAITSSRSISPAVFDLKELGDWGKYVRMPADWRPAANTIEIRSLFRMGSSLKDFSAAVRVAVFRTIWDILRRRKPSIAGASLIAQLLHLNLRLGTEVWRETALREVLTNKHGAVVGALVDKDGKRLRIRAERGIILASGGFSRNKAMREKFLQKPNSDKWSFTVPHDTGDAIQAGMAAGAAVSLMEHAWWMPCLMMDGKPNMDVYARSFPHSIIVDQSGKRFFNESECYCDAGVDIYKRDRDTGAIHSWLIIDSVHRNRYMLGRALPRLTPKSLIKSGSLYRDSSIRGLAKQIGVDADQLQATVNRFNQFAQTGFDEDFKRGLNPYDNLFSDPNQKPNPNLGTIAKAPFYAVQVYPGDIGTKGGLVTDAQARVLKGDGTHVRGLYAIGNSTASVFGSRYPGAGGTIGPGMIFGYVAAKHLAS